MLFGLFWGDWTILILLPGLLISLVAELRVKTTVSRYAAVPLRPGMTGAAVAERILQSNGIYDVGIGRVPGRLTDHYDPASKTLYLSEIVFAGNSVAAVGVAAHEAGHALQHAKGYAPLRLRTVLVPVCNFGARLSMPLFFIGVLFSYALSFADTASLLGLSLMTAGVCAFSLSVLFQLVTLPVEFNASRRAMRCLSHSGTMSEEELTGARRVLRAAALTYVAALLSGLLFLLRLLVILAGFTGRRR